MISSEARQRIFNVKQALRRPGDVREFRELCARHDAAPDEVIRLQQGRALAMARHAFRTSPFYRERFGRAGIDLRDLSDPQALAALPIVDKADLRENFERVRSRDAGPRDVIPKVTGGSTGEPLRLLYDRRLPQNATAWRMHVLWGVHPGDSRAKVWRAGPLADSKRRMLRHALAWPAPRIDMEATHLGALEINRFLDEWDRVRPKLLMGYVGALLEVARFLLDSGRAVAPPTAIESTAAPITETQKMMLSDAFGAPVFDVYQCTEAPVIAAECAEHDGLHVFSDTRWVEIVDEDGRAVPPGQPGIVVVTDLRNRAFPVLRYRLGDVTSWRADPCRCGLPFPRIEPVRGRTTDNLHLPSGHVLSGEAVGGIFLKWPRAVRHFQLVQHVDLSLTLRCVPSDDADAVAVIGRVAADLRETVRGEVPVRLEVVDVIPHDRGKTRFFIREGAPAAVPSQPTPVTTVVRRGSHGL